MIGFCASLQHLKHNIYPPASEARREVANLTERKNLHTPVYAVKEFVLIILGRDLSVALPRLPIMLIGIIKHIRLKRFLVKYENMGLCLYLNISFPVWDISTTFIL